MGEIDWCYFCLLIVLHYATTFQKNSLKQNIKYKIVKYWAQLGPHCPFSQKGDFFDKLKCYSCLLIVPHHATTFHKNSESRSWYKRLYKFGPIRVKIIHFLQKRNFSVNSNVSFAYLLCFIMVKHLKNS